MKKILKSLCNSRNIKICDQNKYIKQNKNSLKVLENRRISGSISIQYTATYDILFRIIDLELNRYGYTLNKSPHFVFKKLYPIFFPSINKVNINIDEIVQIRHKVKKNKYIPTANEYGVLYSLYENTIENWSDNGRS